MTHAFAPASSLSSARTYTPHTPTQSPPPPLTRIPPPCREITTELPWSFSPPRHRISLLACKSRDALLCLVGDVMYRVGECVCGASWLHHRVTLVCMIVVDPSQRPTAAEVLRHPWITGEEASSVPLTQTQVNLATMDSMMAVMLVAGALVAMRIDVTPSRRAISRSCWRESSGRR